MNINFKAQPEPQLNQRRNAQPRPIEGKTNYFACRQHFRPLCRSTAGQMAVTNKLNICEPTPSVALSRDVYACGKCILKPVCVMKDPGCISGHFIMPEIEQTQGHMPTGTTVDHIFPGTMASRGQLFTNQKKNFPLQISYLVKEDSGQYRGRTGNTRILKRKNYPVRKVIPEQPHTMLTPDIRAFSPALALRFRPGITENMNYSSSYLDHEIRILEKLRDILQTDSLKEILDCLSKSSLKDKEFISNFIRSDITLRDLLNYRKQYVRNENEDMHLNLQAILKAPKTRGSTEEEKRFRSMKQGSTTGAGTSSDKEQEESSSNREKIRIPTSGSLSSQHVTSIREKWLACPAIQSSDQLLYSKSFSKRPHHASKSMNL